MSLLVLASASAARARLLVSAGIAATIDPAKVDESALKRESRAQGEAAETCALRLAEAKAREVAARYPGAMVLGADQMLEVEGRWLDKPRDVNEARAQLQALNGRRHTLVSAAAIIRDGEVLWCEVERAFLTMRRMSDGFIEHYLAAMGESILTTVGAYALEGLGAQLMEKIEGDYFTILGLPLLPLLGFLREQGALPA
jgi:nucleoside triphosphate pyrophosphatase